MIILYPVTCTWLLYTRPYFEKWTLSATSEPFWHTLNAFMKESDSDVLVTQFGVTHYPFWVFLIKKLSFSHQQIGLCSSALKKEKFCFLGASYWCANKRNAINCNVSAARIEICAPVYYFIMAHFRKRKKISFFLRWIIRINMLIVQIMRKLLWTWTFIYWLRKCKLFVLASSLLQTTRSTSRFVSVELQKDCFQCAFVPVFFLNFFHVYLHRP